MQINLSITEINKSLAESSTFRASFIDHANRLQSDFDGKLAEAQHDGNYYKTQYERALSNQRTLETRVRELENQTRELAELKTKLASLSGAPASQTVTISRSPYYNLTEAERNGAISQMYAAGRGNKIAQIKAIRQWVSDKRGLGGISFGLADAKAFVEDPTNLVAAFGTAY